MSSSLPLTFNPPSLFQKSSTAPSNCDYHLFSVPNFFKPSKSHICFAFNSNASNYEREESRWLREEQRWIREEQRWLREEQRWESQRESLLREIEDLKLQIEGLRRQGANTSVSNVANLLQVLKKEVSQIAESGSSAVPLVVEASAAAEDVEEVVVKEVVKVLEDVKERSEKEEVKQKRTTLRVGSEGDEVRVLQEALEKLGFYSGEEDMEFSIFSSGTERAVKTWQASIGAPETGMMTSELLAKLYMEQKEGTAGAGFKEAANGAAVSSVTEISEIQQSVEKEDDAGAEVSEHRVFLLGENRWEDSSRLKGGSKQVGQSQTNRKDVTTKCMTCRGEGRLMCTECDGTGEPNIEPQFLEWVGEDMKCPYCQGLGYTTCDVCEGGAVPGA